MVPTGKVRWAAVKRYMEVPFPFAVGLPRWKVSVPRGPADLPLARRLASAGATSAGQPDAEECPENDGDPRNSPPWGERMMAVLANTLHGGRDTSSVASGVLPHRRADDGAEGPQPLPVAPLEGAVGALEGVSE